MSIHDTHGNGKGNNGAMGAAHVRSAGFAAELDRVAAYLASEASQQRFEFMETSALPANLSILQEVVRLISQLLDREATLAELVATCRDRLVAPLSRNDSCDQAVLARLTAIEAELSSLEPVMQENVKLRQRDFQFGVLGPIASEVIESIDGLDGDIALLAKTGAGAKTPREDKLCTEIGKLIAIRREALLDLLARRAIVPFATPALSPFEPGKHRPIASRVARKPSERGLISRHIRPGYWRAADAWVVRPQWVEVFSDALEVRTSGKEAS